MSTSWDIFEKTLTERLSSQSPLLNNITQYLVRAGGKRIRPDLVFRVARLFGEITPRHILFAQALESIHAASLFHDDVIDQGEKRRGAPCAHHVWGNTRAVLAGDFLLTRGFSILIELSNLEVLALMQRVAQDLVEGQVQEYELSESSLAAEYIQVIQKKTASLFAAACQGSALLSSASLDHQKALYMYGLYVGTAYQLLDDVAEYEIETTEWQKGHDFIEQKITCPVLLAHHKGECSMPELFSMECFEKVKHILSPFISETAQQALHFYQKAENIVQEYWPYAFELFQHPFQKNKDEVFKSPMAG